MHSILQKPQQEQPIIADDTQGRSNITIANNCQPILTTPQESNTNNTLNDKITTSINNRSLQKKTDFTDAPTLRLTDGTIVNDYSHDINFVARMELMSLEEAETIRTQVNNYPNEYPMPHMKFTRDKIISSICKLKTQHELTKEEIEIFNKIEIELKNISPRYPYKKSLIITYKFLLCKSFLEFKLEMRSLTPPRNDTFITGLYRNIEQCHEETAKLAHLGIKRESLFLNDCSMLKIQELPWDELLNDNYLFENDLKKIYFMPGLGGLSIPVSIFTALYSNEVLIPYTDKLPISFFNKTWWLPLWLLGCSTDQELTVADGFTMGSSEFFEHDLFHLSLKLYKLSKKQIYFQDLFNQIKFIYQHQNLIQQVKFEAIELAMFFIFHQTGLLSINAYFLEIDMALKRLYEISDCTFFEDILVEHKDITSLDVRIATKWLTLMLSEEYINMEITDAIFKANKMKDIVTFKDTMYSLEDTIQSL